MTRSRSASLLLLFALGCRTGPESAAPAESDPASSEPWLATVTAAMRADARAIRQVNGDYVASVPLAGLTGRFDGSGVAIAGADGVAMRLELAAWGRAEAPTPVDPVDPDLGDCGPDDDPAGRCIRRLEYAHGALTEWWLSEDAGIEQGWTVESPPEGDGPLVFRVTIDDALATDGPALTVTDARGREWTIGEVSAWDARGEPLPAIARLEGGELVVEVDDAGAEWPVTVDPTYTTAAWDVIGGEAKLGRALAGAGDVNGDGYDDIVVGARGVGEQAGRAYVFYGSAAGVGTRADATLDGEAPGDVFGDAVAGAGDVNGDGYDDVVVSAPGFEDSTGRIYVFHGGASGISTTAAATVTGVSDTDGFGASVAGVGDVDGDGYDDVAVGADEHDGSTGEVEIFAGSALGISETAATTLTGPAADSTFGDSVAGAGDVNGDGYADVIVGAQKYSGYYGLVSVYHGSAAGLEATAATTLTGTSSYARFGCAVDGAGDVDGDGYDDVIIGAYGMTTYTGKAFVYHGSEDGVAPTPTTTLIGYASSNYFGYDVAGIGDVQGDGYDDVAVGAFGYSTSRGRITVYVGSASGINSVSVATITGTDTNDEAGFAIAGAGDVDADGHPDLLVGAYGVGTNDGAAYVFAGGSSGMATTASSTIGTQAIYLEDPYVSSAGDFDGDGYGDIAVGVGAYGTSEGIVYLYRGGPAGPSDEADETIVGPVYYARLGDRIYPVGDVDGDGYDDLLIGSDAFSTWRGRLGLYRGGAAGIAATATSTLTGSAATSWYGAAAAAAGDLDGDGYDDVVVGAWGLGDVYLYRGSASGLGSAAATWSPSDGVRFGMSVAVGDFDGDGHRDLAVGDDGWSSSQGRVTTYRGDASGFGSGTWQTLYGEATSNQLGNALVAIDVDADGYDDLVVAADGYDSSVGKVYVYYGSASGLAALPATSITGTIAAGYFGRYVRDVGDVNGDGFGDVAIADCPAAGPEWNVYVHEGSAAGLSATATTTLSGSSDAAYGLSLAGAGDVNGDGFDDVLVGGSQQAWLYLGYDVDSDADGSPDSIDCDAADPAIHPDAVEICDGIDQDCDGVVDDGVDTTVYADSDGDGYGDPAAALSTCEVSVEGFVSNAADCDDTTASRAPSVAERCNGIDDDCDGDTDEDGAIGSIVVYADVDGDGRGGAVTRDSCSVPTGYTLTSTDCDDTTARVSPDAIESCDGIDDDCDGAVDEPGATGETLWYPDADADGEGAATGAVSGCTGPAGYVGNMLDCDDADATINTSASERCDGADDDCDGTIDDGVTSAWYPDTDADGYGATSGVTWACSAPAGYLAVGGDCDDANAGVSPSAAEVCNTVDDDCDGAVDDGVTTTFHADADGDGYGSAPTTIDACAAVAGYVADATDCDDTEASVNPAAAEICNLADDDCDGVVDDGLTTPWYADTDGDGYGDAGVPLDACAMPGGYVADATDCDDTDAAISPAGVETCDERDDDCDGDTDEGLTNTYYRDADSDGYGAADAPIDACSAVDGYVADDTDCDDTDPRLAEGVTTYADTDGDGYGDPDAPYYACDVELGYVDNAEDCDDGDVFVHPGAPEVWYDGVDDDCDGNDTDRDGDGAVGDGDCDDGDPDVIECLAEEEPSPKHGASGGTCGCAATGADVPVEALLGLALVTRRRRER